MWRFLKSAFWIRPEIPGIGAVPVCALAAACFAILGFGHPGFWLLGLGLEAGFVTLLASNPKFQAYVNAQAAKLTRQQSSQTVAASLERITGALPRESFERFEQLRNRCRGLRQIASDLKQPSEASVGETLDAFHLEGLDRLLWVFLRSLFTEYALQRFIQQTDAAAIERDIAQLEKRLRDLTSEPASPRNDKIRRTLEDSLQTARDRLVNFEKARANSEFVQLEINRLENKISSLAELAVNRQEPEFISGQVDQVAGSMLEMEKTMNDLQFATGLAPFDEEVPELMQAPTQKVRA